MGQSLGYCRMDSEVAWGPAEGAELGAGTFAFFNKNHLGTLLTPGCLG